MPQSAQVENTPYIFAPSDSEMVAAIDIVKAFAESLKDPAQRFRPIKQFFVGCGSEAVLWDSMPIDPFAEGNPPLVAFSDFSTLLDGRIGPVSPHHIYPMIFAGPKGGEAKKALVMATLWERDRVANGEVEGVHLPAIQEHLKSYTDAIEANVRFLLSKIAA